MTLDELKSELRTILAEEERASVDWPEVEARCLRLSLLLPKSSLGDSDFPHDIYHYLADAHVRRKDAAYAEWQRAELRAWLNERSPWLTSEAPPNIRNGSKADTNVPAGRMSALAGDQPPKSRQAAIGQTLSRGYPHS